MQYWNARIKQHQPTTLLLCADALLTSSPLLLDDLVTHPRHNIKVHPKAQLHRLSTPRFIPDDLKHETDSTILHTSTPPMQHAAEFMKWTSSCLYNTIRGANTVPGAMTSTHGQCQAMNAMTSKHGQCQAMFEMTKQAWSMSSNPPACTTPPAVPRLPFMHNTRPRHDTASCFPPTYSPLTTSPNPCITRTSSTPPVARRVDDTPRSAAGHTSHFLLSTSDTNVGHTSHPLLYQS